MNLLAIRDINASDPLGGLGPRVEKAPETKPATPEPVGVYTDADGKMRTNIIENEAANAGAVGGGVPVWPFPTQPATQPAGDVPEPGAHGFMREPLKVGDRVRFLPTYLVKSMAGKTYEVVGISDSTLDLPGGLIALLVNEGETWERA